MADNWKINGTFFETCNCEAFCPCNFLAPPTEGDCKATLVWHVDDGKYGDTDLAGLNVVLAAHSPGHMMETKWKVAMYIDEKANEAQQGALGQIFGGQVGGHFEVLASLIGEVVGVSNVAVDYQADGNRRSVRIPNIVDAEIAAIEGQGGALVTVSNQPLNPAPGAPTVSARSTKFSYHDHGLDWEFSEKHGSYADFSYAGP